MREEGIQKSSQSSGIPNQSIETATVRMLGTIAKLPNGEKIERKLVRAPIPLGSLLELLHKESGLELRRDSMLVMINGVEARALSDLETVVSPGDEVVLIPMFHGGFE